MIRISNSFIQSRSICVVVAAIMLIHSAMAVAQQSPLSILTQCIDSSAIANNSIRTEINTAKHCAERFANNFFDRYNSESLVAVMTKVREGNAKQAFLQATDVKDISPFELTMLFARLSILDININRADQYYDNIFKYDESNHFDPVLEYSSFCRIVGMFHKAKDLGIKALSLTNNVHEEYVGRMNMANIYLDLSETDKAIKEINAIYSLHIKKAPKDLKPNLDMMRGEIFTQKGDFKTALLYYQDAIKAFKKLPNCYRRPFSILLEMSSLYNAEADFNSAEACLDEAVKYANKYINEIDRNIALSTIYLQWGMILKNLGRLDEARAKFQLSLQTISKIVMKNRNYATDLAEIEAQQAALEIEMKDYTRAEVLCTEAFEIYSMEKYANSPQHIASKASLLKTFGDLYTKMGQYTQAQSKYSEALECYRKLSRNTDKKYDLERSLVFNNRGIMYENMGMYGEAIKNFMSAATNLAVIQKMHPRYVSQYAQTMFNIGNLYRKMDQIDSSLKYMNIALKTLRNKAEFNDNDRQEYAIVNNNLATQYRKLGHLDIAGPFYETAYICGKDLANKSPVYQPLWADILNNYGLYYMSINDNDMALYYIEKALDIRLRLSNGEELSSAVADSYDNLAEFYANQHNYENAEEYYEKSREIRSKLIKVYPVKEIEGYINTMLKLSKLNYDNGTATGRTHSLWLLNDLSTDLSHIENTENIDNEWLASIKNETNYNIAILTAELGNISVAQKQMCDVAEQYIIMADTYDVDYKVQAAEAYNMAGNYSCNLSDFDNAKILYQKAIDIATIMLSINNIPVYTVSGYYNNMGRMYYDMQDMNNAKECYLKGKELLEANNSDYDAMIDVYTAFININLVEYYIFEKNSGIENDDFDNCGKILDETIIVLKPYIKDENVKNHYDRAVKLQSNIQE